ncbi:propeptide amd peptidase M4 [Thermoanaerobacterium thermosaccharolyticum]|uniref:Peptidase propeptide domain-containing protein n=1 Tax=Thermoanaerobacterium thermosaccharolyticum TaxID=1517 RepID=A0A231VJK1_THETR|nr:peptidase propeptide domain-containing protein [Thermoanaerobacterium thermosaccharolyticum]AST56615.1 propeptide amd peptidase M4 [Thermoanaerobacterium thermosaccharolyticum]OXT08344.1 peptidase propeptide domain-containing protein [Thermoanaerobacterium thermosaccharolyticum]
MLKKNMISLLLALIITFSSNSFAFSLSEYTSEYYADRYLNLIKEKMPFVKDMSLESIKKNNDGSLSINMKTNKNIYKTLDVSINNGIITSVDYYVDPLSYSLGESLESNISADDAITTGRRLLENLFNEKFAYISTIKDETYLDDALKKPTIYKLLFKNTISNVLVYNANAYVYIDSKSGDILKLEAKWLDKSLYNKEREMLDANEAAKIFKEKFDPVLVYLKNDNSDFPKYDLYYIPSIDYNFLGISATDGEIVDYNGDKLNNDIIYIKGNSTEVKSADKNISYDVALEIAKKEVSNLKINDLNILNSKKIDKYFLTGKTAYAFNMNQKDGNLIANASVAVDEESGKVISENIDISNNDGLFDTEGDIDRVIDYVKGIFSEKTYSLALIKNPAIYGNEKTYLFYRIYNNAIVMDNYLRIKTDKDGKIINVSINWDDAEKSCKKIVDENVVKNIFLGKKPILYYIYSNEGKIEPVYLFENMNYIIDATSGRKISANEFEKIN